MIIIRDMEAESLNPSSVSCAGGDHREIWSYHDWSVEALWSLQCEWNVTKLGQNLKKCWSVSWSRGAMTQNKPWYCHNLEKHLPGTAIKQCGDTSPRHICLLSHNTRVITHNTRVLCSQYYTQASSENMSSKNSIFERRNPVSLVFNNSGRWYLRWNILIFVHECADHDHPGHTDDNFLHVSVCLSANIVQQWSRVSPASPVSSDKLSWSGLMLRALWWLVTVHVSNKITSDETLMSSILFNIVWDSLPITWDH